MENSHLTSVTDAVGLVTTILPILAASSGKLLIPQGGRQHFSMIPPGNLIRITNPDGTFVTYVYDTSGNRLLSRPQTREATAQITPTTLLGDSRSPQGPTAKRATCFRVS